MEANNMAAMREALELFAHMNDDGFYDKSPVVRSIVNKSRAALAAPPRNCDRFRDWDSAAAEYERLVQEGKAEDGTWCEWLFSVGQYASAQEGAANA